MYLIGALWNDRQKGMAYMKKCFVIMIIITLMLGLSGLSFAQSTQVKVYVDGERVNFPDQEPFIDSNSRTLVPVRFVSEALGAGVDWIESTRTVRINHKGETISLGIGLRQATVGSRSVTLDTSAEIVNNRTMVPLRFVSECLGAEVEWNGNAREVYITTQNAVPVKLFEGRPYNQKEELPTSDYLGYIIPLSDKPEARISYITVDDLPAQVGLNIIYSLTVNDEYIHVKQRELSSSIMPSPVSLHIKENGLLTRNRCYGNGQHGIYIYSYPLTLKGEIADGLGKADKTKIEAFVFHSYNKNINLEALVIANPLYKGAD